jgi:hypothetical protein
MDSILEKFQISNLENWKFQDFMNGKSMKWCPQTNCHSIAVRERSNIKEIHCRCGHYFCFDCLEKAHRPASCEIANDGIQKITLNLRMLIGFWLTQNLVQIVRFPF